EEEGLDAAYRAFAEACWEDVRESWQRRRGDVRMSAGHVCVARLLRGRCTNWSPFRGETCESPPCIPPGADHVELYVSGGRPQVFVSQPYDLGWNTLVRLVQFCLRWGLAADVSTESWHFPGRTLLVEIRKAGNADERAGASKC
ncbi:MAG: hypothetical protein AB1816_07550, partial [Bacillota bacterium]